MATLLDEVVERLGGYDKLSAAERATYREHLKVLQGKSVSIDDSKSFVRQMITVIERELVETKEGSHESIHLKARLKNFLVMEAFLFSPERAKKALEIYYKENFHESAQ